MGSAADSLCMCVREQTGAAEQWGSLPFPWRKQNSFGIFVPWLTQASSINSPLHKILLNDPLMRCFSIWPVWCAAFWMRVSANHILPGVGLTAPAKQGGYFLTEQLNCREWQLKPLPWHPLCVTLTGWLSAMSKQLLLPCLWEHWGHTKLPSRKDWQLSPWCNHSPGLHWRSNNCCSLRCVSHGPIPH